jgi:hypothetical protein
MIESVSKVWGESADLLLTACKARPLTQCEVMHSIISRHTSPGSPDLQVPMPTVSHE